MLLSAGQVNDICIAEEMMKDQEGLLFLGDKGYDSDAFIDFLVKKGFFPVIPSRHSRKEPRAHDSEIYKNRNWVERLINRVY